MKIYDSFAEKYNVLLLQMENVKMMLRFHHVNFMKVVVKAFFYKSNKVGAQVYLFEPFHFSKI